MRKNSCRQNNRHSCFETGEKRNPKGGDGPYRKFAGRNRAALFIRVSGRGGRHPHPFGENPVGLLTYTVDGFITGQLGRAERERVSADDWGGRAGGADHGGGAGVLCLLRHESGPGRNGGAPGGDMLDVELDGHRLTLSAPFITEMGGSRQPRSGGTGRVQDAENLFHPARLMDGNDDKPGAIAECGGSRSIPDNALAVRTRRHRGRRGRARRRSSGRCRTSRATRR